MLRGLCNKTTFQGPNKEFPRSDLAQLIVRQLGSMPFTQCHSQTFPEPSAKPMGAGHVVFISGKDCCTDQGFFVTLSSIALAESRKPAPPDKRGIAVARDPSPGPPGFVHLLKGTVPPVWLHLNGSWGSHLCPQLELCRRGGPGCDAPQLARLATRSGCATETRQDIMPPVISHIFSTFDNIDVSSSTFLRSLLLATLRGVLASNR